MTLAAVRAEIATNLRTIDSLSGRVYEYAPDSVQPPVAFVGSAELDPRVALGGVGNADIEVWVLVSRAASMERAAKLLDPYVDLLGSSSITAAIAGPGTDYDDLDVVRVAWPVSITVGAGEYAGARFECEVLL